MLRITGAVFLALVAVGVANNSQGVLYPFGINSQLDCHIVNPFEDIPGQPKTISETPPKIPFDSPTVITDADSGDSYKVYLPQSPRFRVPSFKGLDEQKLLEFLGSDFNSALTSVKEPTRPPPRACDLLPALFGSAGQTRQHIEVVQEPVQLFDEITDDFRRQAFSLLFNQTLQDLHFDTRVRVSDDFDGIDLENARRIQRQTNTFDELCDWWIAKCPLTPRWVKLPQPFYYPRYLASSTCSGKNCSIPRGLTCNADFSYSVFVTVLRWDCCFNHYDRQTLWECGWRKVQIPVFCDCTCSCYDVSHP